MSSSGRGITYRELDSASCRLASALDAYSIQRGSTVAVVLENRLEWAEITWALARSGRTIAPLNSHLTEGELARCLLAAEADVVITSSELASRTAAAIRTDPRLKTILSIEICGPENEARDGFVTYAELLRAGSPRTLDNEQLGGRKMFSSGTSGAPKCIEHVAPRVHPADAAPHLGEYTSLFDFSEDAVYLSPAPAYHTAPFRFIFALTQLGATVVCMERFDAERTLATIARFGVTHAQFVPTMLHRLLRLPHDTKAGYDLTSLRVAITGAAPCPVHVKQEIHRWWGPVLHELYGASESYGNCHIDAFDAETHPGSVGRAIRGVIHISDDQGRELPTGEVGRVWFEGTAPFQYNGDDRKTMSSRHTLGWSTVGDIGRLDEQGYLYLEGRADRIIVSGGVNIHPQEIEDVLLQHDSVSDAAVVAAVDHEYGQIVHALVVLADGNMNEGMESRLAEHCRVHLARFKVPRKLTVVQALPRGENGKLYVRNL